MEALEVSIHSCIPPLSNFIFQFRFGSLYITCKFGGEKKSFSIVVLNELDQRKWKTALCDVLEFFQKQKKKYTNYQDESEYNGRLRCCPSLTFTHTHTHSPATPLGLIRVKAASCHVSPAADMILRERFESRNQKIPADTETA